LREVEVGLRDERRVEARQEGLREPVETLDGMMSNPMETGILRSQTENRRQSPSRRQIKVSGAIQTAASTMK
jgi:hypothetical protein